VTKRALLYVHIPFCIRRCRYCTACVVTGDSAAKQKYLDALEREIASALPMLGEYSFPAIYFGGGSPSVMNPDALAKLLRNLRERLDFERGVEVTIEVMPQTVGTPSLSGLASGGYNRISLSAQSVIPAELETLECGFGVQQIQDAVLFLDRFRFNNVNVDIMYGIPGQTEASWRRTLLAACSFAPAHISAYPFPAPGGDTSGLRMSDDELTVLQRQAVHVLGEYGYKSYTANHFARDGRQSKYVHLRLEGLDYIGLGLGARSLVDGITWTNTTDWDRYLAHSADFELLVTDVVELTPEQKEEYLTASRALLV
jgi:oxygen-independent coproporphyrinogen-3 oxidase